MGEKIGVRAGRKGWETGELKDRRRLGRKGEVKSGRKGEEETGERRDRRVRGEVSDKQTGERRGGRGQGGGRMRNVGSGFIKR